MHYYWCLTNDNIEFLRIHLNFPSEIILATQKEFFKLVSRLIGPPVDCPRDPPRFEGGRPRFGDQDGYR